MNYNHYQNNIQILQNKGCVIKSDVQQQPHSRVVTFNCGCQVNSEVPVGGISRMNSKFREEGYRQWICPCHKHAGDSDLMVN